MADFSDGAENLFPGQDADRHDDDNADQEKQCERERFVQRQLQGEGGKRI
jgi:hypothetical protein